MEVKSVRKRASLAPSTVQMVTTPIGHSRMRMSHGSPGFSSSFRSNVVSSGQQYMGAPGTLSMKSKQAVGAIVNEKDKEKKDMTCLNSRLANYIETQGYIEGKCAMLEAQIEELKKVKFPDIDDLRAEYKDELRDHHEALQAANDRNAELEAQLAGLLSKLDIADDKNKMLTKQLADVEIKLKSMTTAMGELEGEVQSQRSELQCKDDTIARNQQNIDRLNETIACLQTDLDAARTIQIQEQQAHNLDNTEHEFEMDTIEKECGILREQIIALKAIQPDCKKYFSHGFSKALEEVKANYEESLTQRIGTMQAQCDARISSIQQASMRPVDKVDGSQLKSELKSTKSKMTNLSNENARLMTDLDALRRRYDEMCDSMDRDKEDYDRALETLRMENAKLNEELCDNDQEIEVLSSTNMDLTTEISMYSKLLSGADSSMRSMVEQSAGMQSRGGAMMADMVMSGDGSGGSSASQNSNPDVSKPKNKAPGAKEVPKKQPTTALSQTSGRVNLKKRCRGNLQFSDVRADGKFVGCENTGRTDMDLSEYTICRKPLSSNPRGKENKYTFPSGFILKAGQSVKIFGSVFEEEAKEESQGSQYLIAKSTPVWSTGDGTFTCCDKQNTEKCSAEMTISR